MRRAVRALLPIAMLAAAGCGERPPNVVLVTVDTLRADRLGCYGYFRDTTPELDALARDALLFEHCVSPMSTTFPAHLSLLTATHPVENGAVANVVNGGRPFAPTDDFRSMAQILDDAGYRTGAFVSATPVARHTGLAAGFDFFDQPDGPLRPAGETNDVALEWLAGARGEPFFLWVHYYDPHNPYEAPPPWNARWRTDAAQERYLERRDFAEISDPRYPQVSTEWVNNAYDGEVSYVDHEIGRLLRELARDPEEWARTIVVVVGDHGEALGEHGLEQHGTVWGEQLRVPLIVRAPGVEPRRVSRLVRLQDVLPTVCGLAVLPGAEKLRKQASGADRLAGEGTVAALAMESGDFWDAKERRRAPRYSMRDGDWKLIHDPRGEDRLFDVSSDPFELDDVGADHPDTAERLRTDLLARLARYRASPRGDSGAVAVVDPETVEAMRALGYVK